MLHLVETLKGWDGDKDDNSLLAVTNFNLNTIKVSVRAPRFIKKTMVRSPSDSTTGTPTHIQDSSISKYSTVDLYVCRRLVAFVKLRSNSFCHCI